MLARTMITTEMIRRVLSQRRGEGGAVTEADARAVLEIACLAVASDGTIAEEERAVLHLLSSELRAYRQADLDALVHACNEQTRDERVERLRAVGASLSSDAARHLAYRVSIVTAMADLAAADEEFEFDLDLQDALDLPTDVADDLSAEVHAALTPED